MLTRSKKIGSILLVFILSACGGGSGGGGLNTSTVSVAVNPPSPTQSLSIDRNFAVAGSEVTLSWKSSNTSGCIASGAWTGSLTTSGKQTITVNSEGVKLFKVSCAVGLESTTEIEVLPEWTSIPDPNFEAALIAMGLDNVLDRRVPTINLLKVEQLIITVPGFEFDPKPNQGRTFDRLVLTENYRYSSPAGMLISNLSGIENFRNLRLFWFEKQNTAIFPLSKLKKLRLLGIWQSPMTKFDPTGLENLEFLGVSESGNSDIDISSLVNLEEIAVQNAAKTPFILGNGTQVPGISKLDTTKNPLLQRIYIDGNRIDSIDISRNPLLTDFWAYDNELTSIDVSSNKALRYLLVRKNRLSRLDLRGRGILFRLDTRDNPSLSKIAVDDPTTYTKIRDACAVSCEGGSIGGSAVWTSPYTQFTIEP